ncbi:MAG TPA: XVIPCD domain-containing protein [Dyella sp.]|uniref:XVIPCD domain-containing protein n=1 Tax=Dyella sp. TaxID=1869338 RepID=UPI002F95B6CB
MAVYSPYPSPATTAPTPARPSPALTPQANAIINAYGNDPSVGSDRAGTLRSVILASPVLTAEFNRSVADGHVRNIAPLTNPHAGGEYEFGTRTISLPATMFDRPAYGRYDANEATFTLAHELQHSFNSTATRQAYTRFEDGLREVAKSSSRDHDYTAPIGNLIQAYRRDEAGAEVAGWNAMVSAASQQRGGGTPTLKEIYQRHPGRMDDFIDVDRTRVPPTYSLKPNLQVNPDMTMTASPHNLDGMGQNFFDKARPKGGLGQSGTADYPNYYGAYAIGVAAQYEQFFNRPQPGVTPPEMSIDLAKLHLSQETMEGAGIDLGNAQSMSFKDKSTNPPTTQWLQHTADGDAYEPAIPPNADSSRLLHVPPDLDHPGHPDHALYQQARDAVHRLDAQQHRAPDRCSDNLAAALTVAARRDGLQQVDHAVLSDDAARTFAVQGDLNSPFKQLAEVQTAQAAHMSIAQSSQAWESMQAGNPQALQSAKQQQEQSPSPQGQQTAPAQRH